MGSEERLNSIVRSIIIQKQRFLTRGGCIYADNCFYVLIHQLQPVPLVSHLKVPGYNLGNDSSYNTSQPTLSLQGIAQVEWLFSARNVLSHISARILSKLGMTLMRSVPGSRPETTGLSLICLIGWA